MAKTGEYFTSKANRHSPLYKDGKITDPSNLAHHCRRGLYRLRWRTRISFQEQYRDRNAWGTHKQADSEASRARNAQRKTYRRIEWTGRTQRRSLVQQTIIKNGMDEHTEASDLAVILHQEAVWGTLVTNWGLENCYPSVALAKCVCAPLGQSGFLWAREMKNDPARLQGEPFGKYVWS